MKHTVVALFDRHADAERAADALARSGFDRSCLHLSEQKAQELLSPGTVIEDGPGIAGRLGDLFANLFGLDDKPHGKAYQEAVRRGGTVLRVETVDERSAAAAADALKAAGAIDIDDRIGEWTKGGWDSGGTAAPGTPADTQTHPAAGAAAPPVGREWMAVRRQVVSSGGVRIYSSSVVHGYDDYADTFRADHASRLGAAGGSYDEHDPAYRHGHALASDSRYSGRSWSEVEADAEREWQARHPTSPWQKFKESVRHAWEQVRG